MCICTAFKLINSGYKIVYDYMEEEKILERCEKCHHGKWTKDECRICRDGIPLPEKPTVERSFIFDADDIQSETKSRLKEGRNIRRAGLLTRQVRKFAIRNLKSNKNKSY